MRVWNAASNALRTSDQGTALPAFLDNATAMLSASLLPVLVWIRVQGGRPELPAPRRVSDGRDEGPGERLTRETFAKYRKQGGSVISFGNTEEVVRGR